MIPFIVTFVSCFVLSVTGALCANPGNEVSVVSVAGLSTCCSCLFVAAITLVLGRVSKLLVFPLILYLAFLVAARAFINLVMNMGEIDLGNEWVAILLNSSWQEMGEFCSLYCFRVDVALGALAMIAFVVSSLWMIGRGCCGFMSLRRFCLGILLMLPFVVANVKGASTDDALSSVLFDTRFFCNEGQGFELYHEIAEVGRNNVFPSNPRYVPCGSEPPVFVFVIGESAMRSHWGLYGYGRNTTPEMSRIADELIIFSCAEATHPCTATSLLRILTNATGEPAVRARYALPPLLKAAGFETVLIMAQNHWGEYDGVDALIFSACDTKIYLSDMFGVGAYDDSAVLPELEKVLSRSRTVPLVVFVHLFGSHFVFSKRYPASYDPFGAAAVGSGPERVISEYDNTIAYTDSVLGGIVSMLKRSAAPSQMFYLSDHGETFGPKFRDMSDPDMRDVPMIVWCSPSYRKVAPDLIGSMEKVASKSLKTDRLFAGLCKLFWVDWSELKGEYDFLSVDENSASGGK